MRLATTCLASAALRTGGASPGGVRIKEQCPAELLGVPGVMVSVSLGFLNAHDPRFLREAKDPRYSSLRGVSTSNSFSSSHLDVPWGLLMTTGWPHHHPDERRHCFCGELRSHSQGGHEGHNFSSKGSIALFCAPWVPAHIQCTYSKQIHIDTVRKN